MTFFLFIVLYSLFQSILPLLMLSYFNVELIRSIHASSNFLKRFTSLYSSNTRYGQETPHPRYREGTVTRSVICLIALFILCQVPASILHYIFMFYRNHPILYICYDISNFLILVNSAVRNVTIEFSSWKCDFDFLFEVNFFIFTYFNRKFRRELSRVCFHSSKSRTYLPHTSSHQSFQRKNSYTRPRQANLPLIDVSLFSSYQLVNVLLLFQRKEGTHHLNRERKNNLLSRIFRFIYRHRRITSGSIRNHRIVYFYKSIRR